MDREERRLKSWRRSLLGRIRRSFPSLSWREARFAGDAAQCDVLILDEAIAFRFPMTGPMRQCFAAELAVLEEWGPSLPLSVPRYRWLPPDRSSGAIRSSRARP